MALMLRQGSEEAFLRAQELLRRDRSLTRAECEELHLILDLVSSTQLIALTADPRHRKALRSYEGYIRTPAYLVILVLAILLVAALVMGLDEVWHEPAVQSAALVPAQT
jgi:hypothetical protein